MSLDVDVSIWLDTVVHSSADHYLTNFCYYSKCANLNPQELLDLKLSEDTSRRYYPAERLMETWIYLAKQKHLYPSLIFGVLNAVRSFYVHGRKPLLKIEYVYGRKPKIILTEEILRFRDGFNFYGQVPFDFMISASEERASLRDASTAAKSSFQGDAT
jgi:hypothetical protein